MKESAAAVLLLLFVILSPSPAGGFVLQMYRSCEFEATYFSYEVIFNKQILAWYDLKDQLFIPCPMGCIPRAQFFAVKITKYLNIKCNASQWMDRAAQACSNNIKRFWDDTAQRTTQPTVRIAHIEPVNTQAPVMLACYVYDFYPKLINVTWLKNGDPITSYVTTSTVLPNGDWSYQTQVYLELTPRSGDVYACRVQHSSLAEPLVKNWNPGLTQLQQIKISMAVVVLALGLIFLLAGIISWKKSHSDGYVPIPGDSYPKVS